MKKLTEYDKVFKFISDNKLPCNILEGDVMSISPDFDKTMGLMVKATNENWGDLIGLLDVVILPNRQMGLQSADSVILEIKELFSNLH